MNLKSMILEELDDCEKILYFKPWHLNDNSAIFSKIINPLSYSNYTELILKFLKHPYAHKLAVRNTSQWSNFFKDEIERNILNIVKIAETDIYQRNHLYFILKEKEVNSRPVVIYFDEFEGMLSAAKVFVPYRFGHLFNINASRAFYSENKAVAYWLKRKDNIKEFSRISYGSKNGPDRI